MTNSFKACLIVSLAALVQPHCHSFVSAQQHKIIRITSEDTLPSEVSIAINPTDKANIVAVAMMRGAHGVTNHAFYSLDGGETWGMSDAPNSGNRTQGDDAVRFDAKGAALRSYISFSGLWSADPSQPRNGIFVAKSADKGKTWQEPATVVDHINTKSPFEDKPWLSIDNQAKSPFANRAYIAWTRFDVYESKNPQHHSQIMFSHSADEGKTFSPPMQVSDVGGDCRDDDNTVEGVVPAIGINGEVYLVWAGPRGLEFDKSTDGGKTFGKDKVLTDTPGGWNNTVKGVTRHNGMPVTAVDQSPGKFRGTIYVNWIDERNDDKDVFIMYSRDAGETWSKPARVNDDAVKNGKDQFFSWMAVDPIDGSINIVFYDRRDQEKTKTELTLARSIDGGATFRNIKVDFPAFECFEPVFMGDYIGIDAYDGLVVPAFTHFQDKQHTAISVAIFRFKPGTFDTRP